MTRRMGARASVLALALVLPLGVCGQAQAQSGPVPAKIRHVKIRHGGLPPGAGLYAAPPVRWGYRHFGPRRHRMTSQETVLAAELFPLADAARIRQASMAGDLPGIRREPAPDPVIHRLSRRGPDLVIVTSRALALGEHVLPGAGRPFLAGPRFSPSRR